MSDITEKAAIAAVRRRLADKFPDVSQEQVATVVQGAYARFEQCRVRDFVQLLVERRASAELAGQSVPLKESA